MATNPAPPVPSPVDAHSTSVEQREAYEYWGYLFNSDKTGTPKLKSLLRGLKEVMNQSYENNNNNTHETCRASAPHEQPDLTPTQLAHFYRDLHGNYDQLFLATPNDSIAFIYKSLGCLHSLQPLRHATQTGQMANGDRATAFTDPVVPALKTEGWIMWETIQILLGPEEHAGFLREAVEKWDVKDVETGDVFPKVLPRECFPREPDRHMVAWYEGVSERLRKEAEAEEVAKYRAEDDEPRRLTRGRRGEEVDEDATTDDESVDSRAPALAYFRNPLYRHVDGRPSIVRRNSKRPGLSPRQTFVDKGKEAVGAFGRIAKNVGSPHLWDGRSGQHHSSSRNGSKRRQSHSHLHHQTGGSPADGTPPTSSGSDRREHPHHRRRTGSSQLDVPPQPRPTSAVSSSATADDEWWNSEAGSPPPSNHRHTSPPGNVGPTAAVAGGAGLAAAAAAHRGHSRSQSQHVAPERKEGNHRRHRSAEPTPSGPPGGGKGNGEPDDYFAGANDQWRGSAQHHEQGRRTSAESAEGGGGGSGDRRPSTTPPPVPAGNGVGVSFGPSKGPLFASHVARQSSVAGRGGRDGGGRRDDSARRGSREDVQQYPYRSRHHHHYSHHPQQREYSPQRYEGRRRRRDEERRFDSPRRSGRGAAPALPPAGAAPYDVNAAQNQRFDDAATGYRGDRRRSRDIGSVRNRHALQDDDFYDDEPRRSGEDFGPRRSGEDFRPRRSRDDVDMSREDFTRKGRKQTRFAGDGGAGERGVSGRRYLDGSPWGRESER